MGGLIEKWALYPALHKLEASGLLTVGYKKYQNRVRKYYRLTEEGTKETQSQLEDLKSFMQQLQQLLNGSTDATLVWSISLGYIRHFLFNNYRYFQPEYQKAEQILAIHQLALGNK